MPEHYYVARRVPERFVEVDAARLLLIITRFAKQASTLPSQLHCCPSHAFVGYFVAEYYLQNSTFYYDTLAILSMNSPNSFRWE